MRPLPRISRAVTSSPIGRTVSLVGLRAALHHLIAVKHDGLVMLALLVTSALAMHHLLHQPAWPCILALSCASDVPLDSTRSKPVSRIAARALVGATGSLAKYQCT